MPCGRHDGVVPSFTEFRGVLSSNVPVDSRRGGATRAQVAQAAVDDLLGRLVALREKDLRQRDNNSFKYYKSNCKFNQVSRITF